MRESKDAPEPLELFLEWWMTKVGILAYVPQVDCVGSVEDVTSLILYRKAPFQVQLFIAPPGCIIPEHTHPNVDSFEVYMGGEMKFSRDGEFLSTDEEVTDGSLKGKIIRVRPNELHGGIFGPSGGAFMSIQLWLNGVTPTCVASDYIGKTMGPKHNSQVTSGNPFMPEGALTPQDAASGEAL